MSAIGGCCSRLKGERRLKRLLRTELPRRVKHITSARGHHDENLSLPWKRMPACITGSVQSYSRRHGLASNRQGSAIALGHDIDSAQCETREALLRNVDHGRERQRKDR